MNKERVVSGLDIVIIASAISLGAGLQYWATHKLHTPIRQQETKIFEYLCTNNQGVKEFVRTFPKYTKYDVSCNDGAMWLEVEVKIGEKEEVTTEDKREAPKLMKKDVIL